MNSMNGQTILLTGCAGFIGARTSGMLLDAGANVVGVDNMNDYYDVRLKDYRLDGLKKRRGFAFAKLDIEDFCSLEKLFGKYKFDAVINLAARAGVRYSMENPFVYMTTNALGALNLLECMRRGGVKKFVQASTSSLYAGQKMPFVETMPVNEPISPYAATKKAAEAMAYTYHHLYDIDVTILRYFTVYGPAGRPDMSILRFIKWIDEDHPIELFGDGTQSRDFTYIDDIASGTVAALRPLGFEIINIGGGNKPVTINEMIAVFERELGKKARINHKPANSSDMKDTSADITKAMRLLDWAPTVSPDEGFVRSVKWHVGNRALVSSMKV
jgi:UDP-glucuronate 4-epimerase